MILDFWKLQFSTADEGSTFPGGETDAVERSF